MSERLEPHSSPQSALDFALQWAQLPPEHLRIALSALEKQMAREHEYRMTKMQQNYRLYMVGVIAGFIISGGMLVSAVFLGMNNQVWLAGLFGGPSVLALAALFVLRRTDATQLKIVSKAFGAGPPPDPVPPVVP